MSTTNASRKMTAIETVGIGALVLASFLLIRISPIFALTVATGGALYFRRRIWVVIILLALAALAITMLFLSGNVAPFPRP